MSYRTIKRLLGETSLERKCRFLFGGGLMLLITGSFYIYARRTETLLYESNKTTAQLLARSIFTEMHWKELEHFEFEPIVKDLAGQLIPDHLRDYRWSLLKANPTDADSAVRPSDERGYQALLLLRQGESDVTDIDHDSGEYRYYGPIYAKKSCLSCHQSQDSDFREGELMGAIKITFSLDSTERAVNKNFAFLLTTAIITTFLAMLAAYVIVRYVIVKPVLHLKDVSDEIARGKLDLRADIRTGDEFEELSHAFNRMLRHLTTIQDELRDVNTNLDGKVDELARVNLQLYEMNKLKDEFLATMSHELRTPLNSILGFSDVLADAGNLSGKQQRYVSNIQSSGKSLMVLINDVLDLAKIESGKMELQIVEFSLADLVEQQTLSMLPLAQKKNIDLTWDVDDSLGVLVQDQGKLEQVLNNLLSNAIKFTPEGGRVRVRADCLNDETFELVVEDSGIGIPLEEQATIFEKFRQGQTVPGQKDAMTREYGGTGLGLSIVKELLKLLGGEVQLDSEFGKGSTFTLRLPVRLDERPKRIGEELFERSIGINRSRPPLPTQESAEDAVSDEEKSDRDETAA